MQRYLLKALACGIVLLAIWGCNNGKGHDSKNGAEDDTTKVRSIPVEVQSVHRGMINSFIHLNSVISTEATVQIFPLVGGNIAGIFVEEGDRVQKGDTLLALEDAEIVLAEKKADLEYRKAQHDLARIKELASSDLVAKQDLDQAEYQLDQASLNLQSARLRLDRSRICAPVSGIISQRHVQIGNWVNNGSQLFTLLDDSELISVLDVPEKEIFRLQVNQEVLVKSLSSGEKQLNGWIKRIAPTVDPQSGTMRVTIGIEDPDNLVRSGMYAGFSIITDTHDNAILIPKQSLVYDRDLIFAYVAEDTTAVRRRLQCGFENELQMEIVEGLEENDRLIVVGQNSIKQGSNIRVIQENKIPIEDN
jgi:membrane fusion protein, multidrug efflux system